MLEEFAADQTLPSLPLLPAPTEHPLLSFYPLCFSFEPCEQPHHHPGKGEDKCGNIHFMGERTEAQSNANGLLLHMELGGGRAGMAQVSGLPAMCSLFPSEAIC